MITLFLGGPISWGTELGSSETRFFPFYGFGDSSRKKHGLAIKFKSSINSDLLA